MRVLWRILTVDKGATQSSKVEKNDIDNYLKQLKTFDDQIKKSQKNGDDSKLKQKQTRKETSDPNDWILVLSTGIAGLGFCVNAETPELARVISGLSPGTELKMLPFLTVNLMRKKLS